VKKYTSAREIVFLKTDCWVQVTRILIYIYYIRGWKLWGCRTGYMCYKYNRPTFNCFYSWHFSPITNENSFFSHFHFLRVNGVRACVRKRLTAKSVALIVLKFGTYIGMYQEDVHISNFLTLGFKKRLKIKLIFSVCIESPWITENKIFIIGILI